MRLTALLLAACLSLPAFGEPWRRHPIDRSSRGADGVRLGDVNGDGLLDVATGWEEGGQIRVYLNPGPKQARRAWPAVTVGQVRSPEDAVFADLDGDGTLDVVSCCEGGQRAIFVHWAPAERDRLLDPAAWKTEPIPAAKSNAMWMFALPMQADGQGGVDLIVGAKGPGAVVGWLPSPANPRDLAAWRLHPLYQAGWIMSLAAHDVDGDGDEDVIVSDRKGANRGVLWLENPGAAPRKSKEDSARTPESGAPPWREHRLGGSGQEVMFLDVADLDGDGAKDVLCATREGHVLYLRRAGKAADAWEEHRIGNPPGARGGKSVRVADVNLDGRMDLIHTAELDAKNNGPGVVWMSRRQDAADPGWDIHDISGREGRKFDLVELLDLDADGDLDILACEERDNLGVFWYENPTR